MSPSASSSLESSPPLKSSKTARAAEDEAQLLARGVSGAELKRAKLLVTQYLRDAGVADAGVLAAEGHRLVMQAAAEWTAEEGREDESIVEAALRLAVKLLEHWYAAAKSSAEASPSAEPVLAVALPQLSVQQAESGPRTRAGRLDDLPRTNLSPVVPQPRPSAMRKQVLALLPGWLCKSRSVSGDEHPESASVEQDTIAKADAFTVRSCLSVVRIGLIVATLASTIAATFWFYSDFGGVGHSGFKLPLTFLFATLFGWISFSFWTACCGFVAVLRRVPRSGAVKKTKRNETLPVSAVVMPVYNEDPQAVFANLRAIARSLQSTGHASRFHLFVLSDTTDPRIRLQEELAWAEFAAGLPVDGPKAFYRHRAKNTSRKAGNLADFCRRWGSQYRYMTVLDADSVMSGATLVELVRRMQRDPQLGILQVPPLPVNRQSLFARLQQFAARVYGQIFLEGFAMWSQCDGNYWGHNAILRVRPFMDHCDLPVLPGKGPLGGEILSHDFVEAALMRRAGFKVCLAHDLAGSFEECPATMLAYAQRDQRWCQGNMQHLRLLLAEGLHPVSRVHLGMGALSYLASPLWLGFLTLSLLDAMMRSPSEQVVSGGSKGWLFGIGLAMLLLPKLCGAICTVKLAKPSERGACRRVTAGVVCEMLVSMLIAPIMMLLHTRFVVSTFLGRKVKWNAQQRNECSVSLREAIAVHGGHTLVGLLVGVAVYSRQPSLMGWMLPIMAGLALSIPLSMLLGSVRAGRALAARGLLLTPEETVPPPVLTMQRAALARTQSAAQNESADDPLALLLQSPWRFALHAGVLRANESHVPLSPAVFHTLKATALSRGLGAIAAAERRLLLNDVQALESLHVLVRSHRLPLSTVTGV